MADTSGAIVFGVLGAAASVFAIDYLMSEPGDSWFDQIKDKLTGDESAPAHALPSKRAPKKLGPKPVIPPPGFHQPSEQQAHLPSLSPRATQRGSAQTQRGSAQTQRGAYPSTVTPDMVREAASRLNAILHLNLPTTGVLTTELSRAVKQVQQQYGLSPTGIPDSKVLNQLRTHARGDVHNAVAPLATQATNFISKTFGGPPSSPSTGPDEGVRKAQKALNDVLKTHLIVDGIMGPLTSGALRQFQTVKGLPVSGKLDSATHDALDKLASGAGVNEDSSWLSDMARALHVTGASGDWKSETASLGQAAQDIISKAIAEGNARTLGSLSRSLKAAGFSQASVACDGATHTSGW